MQPLAESCERGEPKGTESGELKGQLFRVCEGVDDVEARLQPLRERAAIEAELDATVLREMVGDDYDAFLRDASASAALIDRALGGVPARQSSLGLQREPVVARDPLAHLGRQFPLGLQLQPVESSNVKSIGYFSSGHLLVEFRSGEIYEYSGVPPETHAALLVAESKGRFLRQHVMPGSPTRKLALVGAKGLTGQRAVSKGRELRQRSHRDGCPLTFLLPAAALTTLEGLHALFA